MSDRDYEGAIDLYNLDGKHQGTAAVHSSHGSLHVFLSCANELASASVTANLRPDEAREFAGALKRAADAAESAVAFVEGYKNGSAA